MKDLTQKNIELIRKWFAQPFQACYIDLYPEILTEDVVLHGPSTGQEERGIQRLMEIDKELVKLSQNLKREIQEVFAIEDRVIVHWTVYALHCHGENEGKHMVVSGHGIYRFRNGKVCEIWQSWDKLSLFEQVGKLNLSESSNWDISLFLKTIGIPSYEKKAALLSLRERECLKLLLQGKTAKETAKIFFLSHRTVESYFESIKNKLNCSSKKELFLIAEILEKLNLLR